MDARANQEPTSKAAPLRVLIVEDSKRIRARLEEALAAIGNVVIVGWAEKEDDALVLARRCPWDMLVLDLQLKQGNGLAFLKSFDARTRPQRGTIAVFTSHVRAHCFDRAMALGADFFFDNTRDFERMLDVVARLAASPYRVAQIATPVN